jgi:hypothetical protein
MRKSIKTLRATLAAIAGLLLAVALFKPAAGVQVQATSSVSMIIQTYAAVTLNSPSASVILINNSKEKTAYSNWVGGTVARNTNVTIRASVTAPSGIVTDGGYCDWYVELNNGNWTSGQTLTAGSTTTSTLLRIRVVFKKVLNPDTYTIVLSTQSTSNPGTAYLTLTVP